MRPAEVVVVPDRSWGARAYAALCGTGSQLRPWHFQWLSARGLSRAVKARAHDLGETVLDVGCGDKPYNEVLTSGGVQKHIGLDVGSARGADLILVPGERWPVQDGSVDGVLCTQVLEFVDDPGVFLAEARRCLRPGGRLLLTAPFVYNEHGLAAGADLARWTLGGLARLTARELDVVEARALGGPASVVGTLFLNGVDATLSGRRRWLKLIFLPLWLLVALAVNATAVALDALIRHPRSYLNVLVVAERR